MIARIVDEIEILVVREKFSENVCQPLNGIYPKCSSGLLIQDCVNFEDTTCVGPLSFAGVSY